MNKVKNGFTIIELLVVIFIIGILSSVITVSFTSYKKKSRDQKRSVDIQTIASTLETYYAKERAYPKILSFNGSWSILRGKLASYSIYWPEDTKSPSGEYGSGYVYMSNTNGSKYIIDATMENIDASVPEANVLGCADPVLNQVDACFFNGGYSYLGKLHQRISGK